MVTSSRTAAALGRACIIFNPTAQGDKARRWLRHLRELRGAYTLKPTAAAGDARLLAAQAVRDGFEAVVAVGGDGTVNEVLNGIADEPNGFTRVRLGVLPAGTVNVFARELGLPRSFARAWKVIESGREMVVDLPKAEFQSPAGLQRRWFAQMAGCGLDARAVELLDWPLKKKIGQFAYVVAAFRALREAAPSISVSDGQRSVLGQLALFGNGRLYGGPIPVFDQADLRDGQLDVCVFPRVNWWVILRYACAYVSPRLLVRGSEVTFQAPAVRVESGRPVPFEVDGEHVGHVPVQISMQSRILRVLVP